MANVVDIRGLKNDKAHQARDARAREVDVSENTRPEVPLCLSARGREIFEDLLDRISELYEPTHTDLEAYILFANNKEQLEYYENYLRINGSTYSSLVNEQSKRNNKEKYNDIQEAHEIMRPRPEYKMHLDCKTLHLKLLDKFYLTQSSRKGVTFKTKKVEEKKNKFAALG